MDYFVVQWRKCIGKVWGVPAKTHCNLWHLICEDFHVQIQLHYRCFKFCKSVISNQNSFMSICAQLALNGNCSKVLHSINRVFYKYNLNKYELNNCNINVLNSLISTDEKNLIVAGSILDLCYIQGLQWHCSNPPWDKWNINVFMYMKFDFVFYVVFTLFICCIVIYS